MFDATITAKTTEFAYDHPGYAAKATARDALQRFNLEGAAVVDDAGPVNERGIGSFQHARGADRPGADRPVRAARNRRPRAASSTRAINTRP